MARSFTSRQAWLTLGLYALAGLMAALIVAFAILIGPKESDEPEEKEPVCIVDFTMPPSMNPEYPLLCWPRLRDRIPREAREAPAHLTWMAAREAHRASIPPRIAFNLVREESAWNPRAVSWAGAYGLAQVKLSTARIFHDTITVEGLMDERTNLRLGFQYLARLRLRFGGWERALSAYNAGPTRHARSARTGEYSGRAYARRVLR